MREVGGDAWVGRGGGEGDGEAGEEGEGLGWVEEGGQREADGTGLRERTSAKEGGREEERMADRV